MAQQNPIIPEASLHLACHIAAIIDIVLEPFFLYLIFTKSTSNMKIFRYYLTIMSLNNIVASSAVGLVGSFVIELHQLEIGLENCWTSSTLPDNYAVLVYCVFTFCRTLQLQLPFVMLLYATSLVCWPKFSLFLKSERCVPFVIICSVLPSVFLIPTLLSTRYSSTCFVLSLEGYPLVYLVFLFVYFTVYSALAVYLLFMLFLKTITHRNSYSKKTLKLIRTIVLNFAILLSALALMYIVPGIFLAHFLVLGDPKYQSFKQFGMSVLVFNCCSYSFVSTIINIVVTKPYRRAVMGKLRMRRATESR